MEHSEGNGNKMTDDQLFIAKIRSIGTIVKHKEQLPYGNNSRGRFIPSENGRRAIFVPSFGVLEKEEVDYLVTASQEQEDTRIRKGKVSHQKQELEQVATAMLKTPEGKRARVGRDIIKENGR